jgi:predicted nicotinamide N-methyase
MPEDLVPQSIELPSGALRLLQPADAAAMPDDGATEWAPVVPYWTVLWRSGVALARELDGQGVRGLRIVELGCGLAVPSLAAARAGATVLATDGTAEALPLVQRNAEGNNVDIETAMIDWWQPDKLVRRAPFDLAVAADVLYERANFSALLSLLPRLAPEAWVADPSRPAAAAFIEQAERRWTVETHTRGIIQIHRLRFA